MAGRIELPYEERETPDLSDPDVREKIRAEADKAAREELRARVTRAVRSR